MCGLVFFTFATLAANPQAIQALSQILRSCCLGFHGMIPKPKTPMISEGLGMLLRDLRDILYTIYIENIIYKREERK